LALFSKLVNLLRTLDVKLNPSRSVKLQVLKSD
jgi:hypothetical protein